MQKTRTRFLRDLNTVEIESLLAAAAPLFIPVGTLEAHGRHLPVGTDTICAEKIAHDLAIKLSGVVAPAIEYGITNVLAQTSPASFFPEDLYTEFVEQIISTFYLQGFKKIIIVNGHGGNRDALRKIIRRQSRRQPIALSVVNWWLIAENHVKKHYAVNPGGHAAIEETAAMLHYCSELVTPDNYQSETDDYVAEDGIWLFPPPGEVILNGRESGRPDFDRGKSTAFMNSVIDDLCERLKKWLDSVNRLKGGLRP
jgi:creatinine amidohydrolase